MGRKSRLKKERRAQGPGRPKAPPSTASQLPSWGRVSILLLITILALGLRLAYIRNTVIDRPVRADAREYVTYAWNILEHGTFSKSSNSEDPVPDSFRSPGYPAVLALARLIAGNERFYSFVLTLQALLGAALVPLSFLIARRLLPFWGVLLACGLVALSPHLVSSTSYLLTETTFGVLLLAALATFVLATQRGRSWLFGLSGCLFGLAYLVNQIVLLLPVILALIYALAGRAEGDVDSRGRQRVFQGATVFLVVFSLFWGGWAIRNRLSVPSGSTSGGSRALATLTHGTYPGFIHKNPRFRYFPYRDDPEYGTYTRSFADFSRIFWSRFKERPLRYLSWYLAEKPYYVWSWNILQGQGDVYIYPVRRSLYSTNRGADLTRRLMKLLHPWLLVLLLIGTIWTVGGWVTKRVPLRADETSVLFVTVLYFTLVYSVFASWPRYSIPVRPVLYLCAVWTVVALLEKVRAREP